MTSVKVLVKGYARKKGVIDFTSSSVVLIRHGKLNIIVDPGINRKKLLRALVNEGLTPCDVDYVILTHVHVDHCFLVGLFTKAVIMDYSFAYYWSGRSKKHKGVIPGTSVRFIKTPGHDDFHCSVAVKTDDLGTVVVAGDVFWWTDDEIQVTGKNALLAKGDVYALNKVKLRESREKLLGLADYIIPGHGPMFKVF